MTSEPRRVASAASCFPPASRPPGISEGEAAYRPSAEGRYSTLSLLRSDGRPLKNCCFLLSRAAAAVTSVLMQSGREGEFRAGNRRGGRYRRRREGAGRSTRRGESLRTLLPSTCCRIAYRGPPLTAALSCAFVL